MAVEADDNYDILIVGGTLTAGGLAGLSCAVSLLSGTGAANRAREAPSVALLEWQERLGGRLYTCQVGDLEADAGAAWVHGVDGNPLIEDGWITSEDLVASSAQNIWLHGPAESDSCSFGRTEADERWETRLAAVGRSAAAASALGRSLEDGLQESEAELGPMNDGERQRLRMLEGWFGISADRIGLLEWDGDHGSMGDYPGAHCILKGGTRILVERMEKEARLRGLKVFLGHEVLELEELEDGVLCRCHDRCFRAAWVVVTVSLGVLQSRGPRWLSLPERPLQRLDMCHYNKLLLRVSEAAAERFPVFTHLDSKYFWQLFNYWPLTRKPLLSLASLALESEELTELEAREMACELLHLEPHEISAMHFTRWGQIPWCHGSYSVSSKHAEWDDIRALLAATEGRRIKLAGEHTHEEHQVLAPDDLDPLGLSTDTIRFW
ncbi:Polyamine oxidase 3 (OsPAO3) [Durusdinium trenchii]|uniref:Polyamine oxidase 3 (OsPAO3) n=1 Tax=Durusdinium trenchii TaxID=1381693 RepID=A0ABP0IP18_9DINO